MPASRSAAKRGQSPVSGPSATPGFTGRSAELIELLRALSGPVTTTGPVRLLTGPAGIGKTRLALELAANAEASGWRVVWGHCWDAAGAPPYWPWTQVVRELMGRRQGTDLAGLLLDEPSGADRFEVFDAVAGVVASAVGDRRLVVILDDLHEADDPSLLLTRFVARQLRTEPLLIVATARDIEPTRRPNLAEHLASITALGAELALGGLSVDEVAGLLGGQPGAEQIHDITGGNPLYVEQVLRAGAAESVGIAATRPGPIRSAADGLRLAVRSRIEALEVPARDLLQAAAVLGLRSSLDEVVALLDSPDAGSGLALAEASGLYISAGPGRGEVSHPLVAEVSLGMIPEERLQSLHRRAAELLVDIPDRIAERAHHLLRSGSAALPDAVAASLQAATAATEALAHEDASWHYRRALDAIAEDPDPVEVRLGGRLDLLLGLGATLWRTGRLDEAEAAFDEAWRVADALEDPTALARAALRTGVRYNFGLDQKRHLSDRSRAALDIQPADASIWRSRLLADLASREVTADRLVEGRRMAAEALALARRSGDPLSIGSALVAQQITALGPSTLQQRIDGAHEILACARESGDHDLAVQGRFLLMVALLERGDIRALDAELVSQHGIVTEMGEPRFARFALWFQCTRSLLDGDPGSAEQRAEESYAISRAIADPDGVGVHGGQIGVARWMQGRLLEMEPLYLALRAEEPEEPLWTATLAFMWADQGLGDAAAGALESFPDPSTVPETMHWLLTMAAAADAAATFGTTAQVAALWEQLLPYADRMVPVAMGAATWGPVARPLGRLALRLGRVEEAIGHLTTAVEISARLGARPWLIDAQTELASTLMDHRGDDARIPTLVSEASEAARHLGLELFIGRSAELADRLRIMKSAPVEGAIAATEAVGAAGDGLLAVSSSVPKPPVGHGGAVKPSVEVLGAFSVTAADGTVARWTSRKARDLLKILVSRRGAPINREVLMDLLWPDEDPASLSNRLSVALTTARRALDPDRRFATYDLVVSSREAVHLRLSKVEVDAEQFLNAAAEAMDAHRRGDPTAPELATAAMRSHRGEALPDEPHADWASALRDEVRTSDIELARVVADAAAAVGDPIRAADAWRRLLDFDQYDETANLGLVVAFRSMGAHGQANAAYATYQERMADLDVPAAPDPTR